MKLLKAGWLPVVLLLLFLAQLALVHLVAHFEVSRSLVAPGGASPRALLLGGAMLAVRVPLLLLGPPLCLAWMAGRLTRAAAAPSETTDIL